MKNPLTKIIHKIMPAVVSITISKSLEALEKEIPPELLPFLPFGHLEIPEENINADGKVKIGGGSGFIVDKKGIILTNRHVVFDPHAEYTVITDDNKKYKTEVLARDPINDVAILKISSSTEELPIVSLGDSSKIELGEEVLAIGNALGLFKNTVSRGIVSGLSRSIKAAIDSLHIQELRGLIQTDAAINPGNSGGPLINLEGKAIGINTAIVLGAENLGFAIPTNTAERDLADLNKFGRILKPLLGIRYITIDEKLKKKLNLSIDHGAFIIGQGHHAPGIIKNSPADKAGIREKDIILSCNNEKVNTENTIQDFLEKMQVNDTLNLKILRNNKEFDIKVTLGERK